MPPHPHLLTAEDEDEEEEEAAAEEPSTSIPILPLYSSVSRPQRYQTEQ